jgi:hypothetical protein
MRPRRPLNLAAPPPHLRSRRHRPLPSSPLYKIVAVARPNTSLNITIVLSVAD